METCKFCGKEYSKKGIGTHIWRIHGKGKTHDPNKNRVAWNKGLTKETSKILKQIGDSLKEKEPAIKGKKHTKEAKLKMRAKALKAFADGRHATWKSRKIRSYPELYFEKLLKTLGIFDNCEVEKFIKHNKNSNYFMDFYFDDRKLNLEIDGRQHQFPERIESDKTRDLFLESQGIKVFRIDWKNPKTKEGKKYLEEKIKEFLDLYALLV